MMTGLGGPTVGRPVTGSRRTTLRRLGGLAAGAALGRPWTNRAAAQGLASPAGTIPGQRAAVEDELRIIAFETFYGLDPVHEFSGGYLRGFGAAEGLMRFTAYGQVEPDLAQSAEMLDPHTWKVNLRPEARFWSGAPVTAGAVVASLERSRALAPAAAQLLRGIHVEPFDDWSVLFQGEAPIPGLPLVLLNQWLVIHNAAAYGPQDNAFDLGAADLTGPFRVVDWQPRTSAMLERHEGYWGVRPRLRRIGVVEVTDVEARSIAALTGEAHIVRWISSGAARQIARSHTMRLVPVLSLGPEVVHLNIQRPPFDDLRVRQALAWSVDREAVLALALDGRGAPAASLLAPNPMYPEARRSGYTRVDLPRAAALLDEAGWRLPPGGRVRLKDGRALRFRLLWWGAGQPIAEVLQSQWAGIGAEVVVEGAGDYGLIQARRAQDDWEALIETATAFGDPPAALGAFLAPGGAVNYMRFQDPIVDRLLAEAAQQVDPEARRQLGLAVNERQAELAPSIPVVVRERTNAVSRQLRNYHDNFLVANPFHQEVHPDLWIAT